MKKLRDMTAIELADELHNYSDEQLLRIPARDLLHIWIELEAYLERQTENTDSGLVDE